MQIKTDIFKIETNKKPTPELIEGWFNDNNINAVRYFIQDVDKNSITLVVSHILNV